MAESIPTPALRRPWTKPQLRKVGTIADVAGPNPVGTQGATTKS